MISGHVFDIKVHTTVNAYVDVSVEYSLRCWTCIMLVAGFIRFGRMVTTSLSMSGGDTATTLKMSSWTDVLPSGAMTSAWHLIKSSYTAHSHWG